MYRRIDVNFLTLLFGVSCLLCTSFFFFFFPKVQIEKVEPRQPVKYWTLEFSSLEPPKSYTLIYLEAECCKLTHFLFIEISSETEISAKTIFKPIDIKNAQFLFQNP